MFNQQPNQTGEEQGPGKDGQGTVSEQEQKAAFQQNIGVTRLFDSLPKSRERVSDSGAAVRGFEREDWEPTKTETLPGLPLEPIHLSIQEQYHHADDAKTGGVKDTRDTQHSAKSVRYSRNMTPKKTGRHPNLRKPVYTQREPTHAKSYGAFLTETRADFQPLYVPTPRLTFSQQHRSWTAPSNSRMLQRPKSEGLNQWRMCKQRLNTEVKVFPFWGELRRCHTQVRSALPTLSMIQKEEYVIDFEERRKVNPTAVPYKEFYTTIRQYFKEIPVK